VALLALTLAALAWVIAPIVGDWARVRRLLSDRSLQIALAGGSVGYALCLWSFMAPGWWWLTRLYGRTVPLLPTAAVWCRTQIVKYLPGNVAHYVGRQVMGAKIGLRQAEMAGASVLELGSILAAAGLIGVTGVVLGAWHGADGSAAPGLAAGGLSAQQRLAAGSGVLILMILLGFFGWPIADGVLRRLPLTRDRMAGLPKIEGWSLVRSFAPAVLIHVLFLSCTGLLLWWLCLAAAPEGSTPPSALRAVWVYAVAWAVGTITPGAPAGAGVREAILTFELASDLGRPEAAAIALALRLVTTFGDAIAFAVSLGVPIGGASESTRGTTGTGGPSDETPRPDGNGSVA